MMTERYMVDCVDGGMMIVLVRLVQDNNNSEETGSLHRKKRQNKEVPNSVLHYIFRLEQFTPKRLFLTHT